MPHAGLADVLIVSARSAGGAADAEGLSLYLVPRGAPGVELVEYLTVDGQRAADIRFNAVRVPKNARLGAEGDALPAIEAALDLGLAALCAEAVSIMQAADSSHRRVSEHAAAIRTADRPLSGAAAPRG